MTDQCSCIILPCYDHGRESKHEQEECISRPRVRHVKLANPPSGNPRGTSKDPPNGRERVLMAALRLMAEKGADAVSLREINLASGLRNASGVQYHFGNREGLILAIVEAGMARVDGRRRQLLLDLEVEPPAVARDVIRALVEPLAAELHSEPGRQYLMILQQLGNRPVQSALDENSSRIHPGLRRCTRLLAPQLAGLPVEIRRERSAHLARFLLRALSEQARQHADGRRPRLANAAFASNLVDELLALLSAAASPTTLALLGK